MSEELLPCPFCGSSAVMECASGEYWAGCIGCGMWTPMYYFSPERAAAKWNARFPAVAAPVQVVDNASACRFLACLRDSAGSGYVPPYLEAADGSYAADAHIIDGCWSTEDLRAAILAALGEK